MYSLWFISVCVCMCVCKVTTGIMFDTVFNRFVSIFLIENTESWKRKVQLVPPPLPQSQAKHAWKLLEEKGIFSLKHVFLIPKWKISPFFLYFTVLRKKTTKQKMPHKPPYIKWIWFYHRKYITYQNIDSYVSISCSCIFTFMNAVSPFLDCGTSVSDC